MSLFAAQLLIGLLQAMVAVAAALLLTQLLLKIYCNDSRWFKKRQFAALNVICSSASSCVCNNT